MVGWPDARDSRVQELEVDGMVGQERLNTLRLFRMCRVGLLVPVADAHLFSMCFKHPNEGESSPMAVV
jgi:hypothetical protein